MRSRRTDAAVLPVLVDAADVLTAGPAASRAFRDRYR
jgi:hypothetical protein